MRVTYTNIHVSFSVSIFVVILGQICIHIPTHTYIHTCADAAPVRRMKVKVQMKGVNGDSMFTVGICCCICMCMYTCKVTSAWTFVCVCVHTHTDMKVKVQMKGVNGDSMFAVGICVCICVCMYICKVTLHVLSCVCVCCVCVCCVCVLCVCTHTYRYESQGTNEGRAWRQHVYVTVYVYVCTHVK
jgi:hypothetical protein